MMKFDTKIVLGDFNAKVGQEKIYKPTIGNFSKHIESNENGRLLIDFAIEKDLKIVTA